MSLIRDVFFSISPPAFNPVPADDHCFKDVFQRIIHSWHGSLDERASLVSQLPVEVRNSIYRVIAEWAGNKEDLEWGARHCRLPPQVLMGVVMEAYRKRISEQAKRYAVADAQVESLKGMYHMLLQCDNKDLIKRVQWNFQQLPRLVQLRCLSS